MNTNSGVKICGFIDIELINNHDNTRRFYHNTITQAGKQFLLDRCANSVMNIGGDTFGCFGSIDQVTTLNNNIRAVYPDECIHNVLLNLGSGLDGVTEKSSLLPMFESDSTVGNKLVGFAGNSTYGGGAKLGVADISRPEYVVDPFSIAKRWKYDIGIASGTIDTVAMMPGSCLSGINNCGVTNKKCIDRLNILDTKYKSLSTSFLPPGIPGYTSNDEVLLNFEYDGNNKWKYNLVTGEMVALQESDNFAVLPKGSCDYLVDGNYVYVLNIGSGNPVSGSWQYPDIAVYNISNLSSTITTIDLGQNSCWLGKLCKIGERLFVTLFTKNSSQVFELTKSGNYFNNKKSSSFDEIGIVIPDGLKNKNVGLGVGSYGASQYILYMMPDNPQPGNNNFYYSGILSNGVVFSNLKDVVGSASAKFSNIGRYDIAFNTGSNKGFIGIGLNSGLTGVVTSSDFPWFNQFDGKRSFMQSIKGSSGAVVSNTLDYLKSGVFITLEGWSTDVLSFVKLNQPIQKGDNDIMYVSYGYKVL